MPTLLHRFPVHRTEPILGGFSSSLNWGGKSFTRAGMCRSPIHNTSTIFAVCRHVLGLQEACTRQCTGSTAEGFSAVGVYVCVRGGGCCIRMTNIGWKGVHAHRIDQAQEPAS